MSRKINQMEPRPQKSGEQEIITIFDPFDEPFGPLSINAQTGVVIDGEVYKSVAHYVFSRPLKTPAFRSLVEAQTSTRNLKDLMIELYRKNLHTLENYAMDRALVAKFNIPEMRDALIATGDAVLIYRNDRDTIYGVDSQGYGENRLGKKLMELRDRLAIEYTKYQHIEYNKRYFNAIYTAYLADKILQFYVKTGRGSLLEIIDHGMTAEQIVDFYGRDRIIKEAPTYFAVMEMFRKNLLPRRVVIEPTIPGALPRLVLADSIDEYKKNFEDTKKRAIFDMYFDRVLAINFPNLTFEAAQRVKDRELGNMDLEEYQKFVDRVYKLYQAGRIDPLIATTADRRFANAPSEQDVESIKEIAASILKRYDEYTRPHGIFNEERPVEEIVIVEKKTGKKSAKDIISYIKEKMAKYEAIEPEKLLGKTEKDFSSKDAFMRAYQQKLDELKAQVKIQYQTEKVLDELFDKPPSDIDLYMEKFEKMSPEEIVGVPMTAFKTKGGFRRAYQKKMSQIRLEGMRLIKEEKEKESEKEPQVYSDEGRYAINFGDHTDPYYGFLSNQYTYKFLMIDNLPYPTVDHYITGVKLTALTYVKNTVVSHPYLKIDPTGNSYSFENYKPFDELVAMFDTLSTRDIINTVVDTMIKANKAKFKNDKLASLLLATGDAVLVYGDYRDDLLGIGDKDSGENLVGKDLMENRMRIGSEGVVQPAKVKILPIKSVQDLTMNNQKFKDWFNMRINDAVASITKFAEYLGKKGMMEVRISASMCEFVLFQLYGNCMSIAEKSHEIYKIPKDFAGTIRKAFSDFEIDRSAIEVIWRYGTFLAASMTEFFKGIAEKPEDIDKGVEEVTSALTRKTDLRCPGPYTGAEVTKNCVGHAFRNIFRSLQSFFKSRNIYFDVESEEMNFAMGIIAPKGDVPDLEIKDGGNPYNMIAIVGGVPVDALVSKSARAPKPDVIITRNQAETIEAFGQAMFALSGEKANIAVSRLIFFATSDRVDKVAKKVEIVIAEEPVAVEKEIGDTTDEEEAVEDYGEEVEEVEEED